MADRAASGGKSPDVSVVTIGLPPVYSRGTEPTRRAFENKQIFQNA
jgi:hypothetical protein